MGALELLRRMLADMGERDSAVLSDVGAWGVRGAWRALRPSLPPLLFLALALWGSVAAGIDGLFGGGREDCLRMLVVGMLLLLVGLACLARRHALAACLVLGVALGLLLAASHCLVLMGQRTALLDADGERLVEVVRDSRANDYGSSALARAGDGALVRLSFSADAQLMAGQLLRFQGSWSEPSAKTARDSWRDGIVATAYVRSFEIEEGSGPLSWLRGLRSSALGLIDGVCGGLEERLGLSFDEPALFLRAVLFGYADGLYGSAFYQAVKVDGLAHLVAVSGAHLVIVCGFIAAAVKRLPLGRAAGIGLQVLVIACYLVLTGAPVSAVRAAIMASLGMLSFFSARRPYALGGLSACIVAMLALDPGTAFSTSFLLSASSTLGIVLFSGLMGEWLARPLGAAAGILADPLALTLASLVPTLPLTAALFGQASLVSPLANVVAAPVFTLLCVGGLAAVALGAVLPPVGVPLLGGLLLLGHAFCRLLELLAGLPCASVPASLDGQAALVMAVVLPAALWACWPRPSRAGWWVLASVALAVSAAFLVAPFLHGDEVVMLDVGQGDAILVRSGPHAVLIDTGTEDISLLEQLGAQGIRSLDAVVVTHPDDDHCGSLPALAGVVGVGRVVVAHDLLDDDGASCSKLRASATALVGGDNLVGMTVGDALACGNIRLVAIGPDAFVDGGGNADSLILLMESDDDADGEVDHTALFCGDAEAEQLHAYARKGRLGAVEVYKVGHHGSRAAIDDELAGNLKPAVSLVSVGAYNRYGHPVASTLESLERAGSTVFRTDEQGYISCRLLPDRLEVRTER